MDTGDLVLSGALVRFWLNTEPDNDLGEFMYQNNLAAAMEKRYFEALAKTVANAVAKAFGGK